VASCCMFVSSCCLQGPMGGFRGPNPMAPNFALPMPPLIPGPGFPMSPDMAPGPRPPPGVPMGFNQPAPPAGPPQGPPGSMMGGPGMGAPPPRPPAEPPKPPAVPQKHAANDYCQHFVDTGLRPQNFLRGREGVLRLLVAFC
jgi:hypothetical protein